jgi:hypothetical protein
MNLKIYDRTLTMKKIEIRENEVIVGWFSNWTQLTNYGPLKCNSRSQLSWMTKNFALH